MDIDGTYTFEAPRESVWEAILDPDILARVLPGCQALEETAENQYKAQLRIKVGPVQGVFNGTVKLSDIVDLDSYHIQVDGKGAPGFVKGVGDLKLEGNGDQTHLHYTGEAHVGGRLASVGQRLMETSAQALIRQSLESLDAQIKARMDGGLDGDMPVTPEAPSQLQFAAGVTRKMVEDWVSEEEGRRAINASLLILVALLVIRLAAGWWAGLLARKIAEEMDKRG